MRLGDERESTNVEDMGGSSGGGGVMMKGGVGTIALVLIAMFFGIDPRAILQTGPASQTSDTQSSQTSQRSDPARDQEKHFVSKVLADTEDCWHKLLPNEYRDPKLVLFGGQVQSACGMAGSAMGPFYCGEDEKVYIDLKFYDELKNRFGAPGDFAQAYVIAHEVGHHVQKVRGTMDKVHQMEARASKAERNRWSVRLELQADFYAGVWAHYARDRGQVEVGDIDQALTAATAIGDDTLQKQAQGYVVPDSFTHGTSEQRVRWFKKGYETGDINQGDTFSARDL
jgi:predicted metalloprotease